MFIPPEYEGTQMYCQDKSEAKQARKKQILVKNITKVSIVKYFVTSAI